MCMVLDRISTILQKRSKSAGNNSKEAPATIEVGDKPGDSTDRETSENSGISRPPGWKPMYGTYEKPVYPKDKEIVDMLDSLTTTADIADFETAIPSLGTNKEHIRLSFYTITDSEGNRTLVIDVYIEDFSEWTPEEKGGWEYPGDNLGMNGPYYMHLANDFEDILAVPPFAFSFVSYNEDDDSAMYSYERSLYRRQSE